jgi:hypothetical protein
MQSRTVSCSQVQLPVTDLQLDPLQLQPTPRVLHHHQLFCQLPVYFHPIPVNSSQLLVVNCSQLQSKHGSLHHTRGGTLGFNAARAAAAVDATPLRRDPETVAKAVAVTTTVL